MSSVISWLDFDFFRQKALKALNDRLGKGESPSPWPTLSGEEEEERLLKDEKDENRVETVLVHSPPSPVEESKPQILWTTQSLALFITCPTAPSTFQNHSFLEIFLKNVSIWLEVSDQLKSLIKTILFPDCSFPVGSLWKSRCCQRECCSNKEVENWMRQGYG